MTRCLDSVVGQTFCDWEAICVDDGSPDNCGAILDDYAAKDSRFKVIHQKNQGLSAARNNGKKLAKGEYIYFLDSDDAMHPQLLEIAYGLAQKYDAELVCFNTYKESKEKFEVKHIDFEKIKTKVTNNPVFLSGDKGKYNIYFDVWTKFYKKELLDGIDFIEGIYFEDYPYTYAVLSKMPKTVVTPTKMHFYTNNAESISNRKSNPQQIKDYHAGINSIYEIYKNPKLKKELEFLKRNFIPCILKHQLGRCRRSDDANRVLMFEEFAKELADLWEKGLISWKGHKLSRYWIYKKLIKDAKK